jgi:hypothetical protein
MHSTSRISCPPAASSRALSTLASIRLRRNREMRQAVTCGIILDVEAHDDPAPYRADTEPVLPGRLVGLQGRLARPFWGPMGVMGVMGVWAVFCGALASNHPGWEGDSLLALAMVVLLADLGWGSFFDLATGTDWFRPSVGGPSSSLPPGRSALPYTQPDSPGGRLFRWGSQARRWWRDQFWPSAGPALLGLLAAAILIVVLALLLPPRLYPLNAVLVALTGVGVLLRRRGAFLAGQAAVLVGLSWLAGHMVFAGANASSLVLALGFTLAAWGVLRVSQGLKAGLWLLNGGLAVAAIALVLFKQPLAAGVVGLLLFGQLALQPSLRFGGDPARVVRRIWPWVMAAMLVAALAIP